MQVLPCLPLQPSPGARWQHGWLLGEGRKAWAFKCWRWLRQQGPANAGKARAPCGGLREISPTSAAGNKPRARGSLLVKLRLVKPHPAPLPPQPGADEGPPRARPRQEAKLPLLGASRALHRAARPRGAGGWGARRPPCGAAASTMGAAWGARAGPSEPRSLVEKDADHAGRAARKERRKKGSRDLSYMTGIPLVQSRPRSGPGSERAAGSDQVAVGIDRRGSDPIMQPGQRSWGLVPTD